MKGAHCWTSGNPSNALHRPFQSPSHNLVIVMARTYPFRTSAGSDILPVAGNPSYVLEDIQTGDSDAEVYFEFYSDSSGSTPATPSAGTITTSGRALNNIWLEASQNATTQASTVSTPDATYTPPILDGLLRDVRIVLSGVAGATHMRATLYKR